MTAAQLAFEYSKLPRVQYDSDDEPIKVPPMRMSDGLRLSPATTPGVPVDKRICNDTDAATFTCKLLNTDAATFTCKFLDTDDIEDIYDNAVQKTDSVPAYSPVRVTGGNPDSMVQDPFNPEERCTLREREEILRDEREYRASHGMPMLVRDPNDFEHWIEPDEALETSAHSIGLDAREEACVDVTRELFGEED